MIRVTFGNNKQFDYIHYYCGLLQIGLMDRSGQSEYYPYDSIKMVEKQVKDLTLEECKKLGMQVDMFADYYEYNCMVLGLDDYIDITDIVKRIYYAFNYEV